MERFYAALRFLTIFPVPGSLGASEESLSRSVVAFPLVGGFVGFLLAAAAWLVLSFFPGQVAAPLLVLFLLGVSGGFHLDGLADCADGFFSARPKEQILVIMRDSHVGVMGVVAVVMVLLIKTAALTAMTPSRFMAALFLMPLAGRCLMVVSMALLPYARKEEGGIASCFYGDRQQMTKMAVWAGGLLYCGAWYSCGVNGVLAAVGALMAILLFAWYCSQKIGGATGDTLGASCEVAETVIALLLTGT